MRGYTLKILGTLAVLAMFTTLSGCAMVEHKEAPAKKEVAPQTAAEEQPAPAPAAKPANDKAKAASADDLKKKRKELDKQERKLVKLEREMRVGRHKLEKAHMSMEHTRLRNLAVAVHDADQAIGQHHAASAHVLPDLLGLLAADAEGHGQH